MSFEDKELRQICEDEVTAKAQYGDEVANMLQNRLADLSASTTIGDLPPIGNHGEINIRGRSYYNIEICNNYHLVFIVNHVKNTPMQKGSIDWPRVSKIKLFKIINE